MEESMSEYTHIKKPYKARCIQNRGGNNAEVLQFLAEYGFNTWHSPSKDGAIFVIDESRVKRLGMPVGWWARVGENDVLKTMSDDEFQLKYQRIAGGE